MVDDIDLPHDTVFFMCAPPRLPDESGGMGIIYKEHGIVLITQADHFVQLRGIAVHRKHTVCNHHFEPLVGVQLQLAFEMLHIGMFERIVLCAAQAYAVHNGSMHQTIRYHNIVGIQYGLKDTGVGIHAGGKKHGIFGAQKGCHFCFQFVMDILCAAYEPNGGHAVAAVVETLMSGLDHFRMARKSQIIVRTHIDDFFKARTRGEFDFDIRGLSGMNKALLFEYTGSPDILQFILVNGPDLILETHRFLQSAGGRHNSVCIRLGRVPPRKI